ncbi:MAG: hypothetical protein KDD62_07880 [Bdellovibrionales bacterium]|nr:hypothetical protein [Bdellovibrionales bacterium]
MRARGQRLLYAFVLCMVAMPLIVKYTLPPSRMRAAEELYKIVESIEIEEGDIALLALDFGPSTKAENEPQASAIIEHLMRRRIPFAVLTQTAEGEGFLSSIPEDAAARLREETGDTWVYGKDWVNLGYKVGKVQFLQGLAKSDDLTEYLAKDVYGTRLEYIPAFSKVKSIKQIKLLGEFTGLTGMFNMYVQFFQRDGYKPTFVHGCTSITIPDAYIFLDSGQLHGLFEGFAGAAWYAELLAEAFPARAKGGVQLSNTALGVGHLTILFLILVGNTVHFFGGKRRA